MVVVYMLVGCVLVETVSHFFSCSGMATRDTDTVCEADGSVLPFTGLLL